MIAAVSEKELERLELPPITQEDSDLVFVINNRENYCEPTLVEFLEFIRRRREEMDEFIRKAETIVKA